MNSRTIAVHQREGAAMAEHKARLEARIDRDLDRLIVEAAEALHVSKTAFVTEALREAAMKVVARGETTLMAPEVFDAMMTSIDEPDLAPELADLAALPRRIS